MDGAYARSGKEPPVRTAVGALGLEKEEPGLGDEGSDGKRSPGFGEEGRPIKGVVDLSDAADTGSASAVAADMLRE